MRLDGLGFALADIPRAADLATARPYPNPRPVERDGIVALLTHATLGGTIDATSIAAALGADPATAPPHLIEENE